MIESRHRIWIATGMLLASLVAAIVLGWTSAQRQLSGVEAGLIQLFALSFGFLASFIFGQISAEHAGRELVRSHARSAFRRVLSLYRSLSRLASVIESDREATGGRSGSAKGTLEKLEAIVVEQIATAGDAVADWRDICPKDVEELLGNTSAIAEVKDE